MLPRFERGPAIVGVCGKSFKCPPAPSETALLLHDYLTARGRRDATEISLVMPFGTPIPPSPDTSQAILAAFAERGIRFVKDQLVKALDPARKVAVLSDGTELPYALFLGIPVHRVPQVVVESGLAAHPYDWVPVNKQTLETRFPGVYAVGDVNGVGTPKAGVFAEGAAQVVGGSDHRAAARRAVTGRVQGAGLLLRGVRPRAGRARGRGFPERPETDRHVSAAVGGARRREDALRLEPASALVRPPAGQAVISSVEDSSRTRGTTVSRRSQRPFPDRCRTGCRSTGPR